MVFAIVEELDLPICFVGTGESVDDFAPFVVEEFVQGLFAGS